MFVSPWHVQHPKESHTHVCLVIRWLPRNTRVPAAPSLLLARSPLPRTPQRPCLTWSALVVSSRSLPPHDERSTVAMASAAMPGPRIASNVRVENHADLIDAFKHFNTTEQRDTPRQTRRRQHHPSNTRRSASPRVATATIQAAGRRHACLPLYGKLSELRTHTTSYASCASCASTLQCIPRHGT